VGVLGGSRASRSQRHASKSSQQRGLHWITRSLGITSPADLARNPQHEALLARRHDTYNEILLWAVQAEKDGLEIRGPTGRYGLNINMHKLGTSF